MDGRAKHFLEEDTSLCDIHADIVKTLKTEIIAGADPRFDEWIYREYEHHRLVRIFTPILLMYDNQGRAIEDWYEYSDWEVTLDDRGNGQHSVLELRLGIPAGSPHHRLTVIGTLEVGYRDKPGGIDPSQAVELNRRLARRSADIRRVLLPYVLETIANGAMRIVGADSTSLHFLWLPEQRRYAYHINSGIRSEFLDANPPAEDPLGRKVMEDGTPQHATTYDRERYSARQLVTLHKAAQSLARLSEDDDLLSQITANTANFLGADVVTCCEYVETDRAFLSAPTIAGRLRVRNPPVTPADETSAPCVIARSEKNVYADNTANHPFFLEAAFVRREGIASTAGIVLKVGHEVVGVMLINYRRPHAFSMEEKQLIESFASSAALALKNRRWIRTRREVDREIIATLDQEKLLRVILQRAVQNTRADRAEIRLFDPLTNQLVVRAQHPVDAARAESVECGLSRWVAENRSAALIDDVRNDPRTASETACGGSRIGVPLHAADHEVVGVVIIENRCPGAFDEAHVRMLEALADQAVIAIKNVETKEDLLAAERIATLGDLAGPLMHRLSNQCGAIRAWAQIILDEGDATSRTRAAEILDLMRGVQSHADTLKSWSDDKPGIVNLHRVVAGAIAESRLPPEIICSVQLPADMPAVIGNEKRLKDVFDNLLQNARDAMPGGGTITIEGHTVDHHRKGWAVITVCDSGPGIPESNHDKIFQSDYSTKNGHRGFGLWWSRAYVRRLKGRLTVENRPGQGACFSTALPVSSKLQRGINQSA